MREGLLLAGHGLAQRGIERKAQAVAEQRLMEGGVAGGQGQRGRVLEDLPHLEVLEVRAADPDLLACPHHRSPFALALPARSQCKPIRAHDGLCSVDEVASLVSLGARKLGADAREGAWRAS